MSEPEALAQAALPLLKVVRFVERLEPGATALLEFHDPYPRWAVVDSGDMTRFPAVWKSGSCPRNPRDPTPEVRVSPPWPAELSVLFIPLNLENEWAAKAEAWMQSEPSPAAQTVRVPLAGGWLLWQPGRAAALCQPEQSEALLVLLARFSFYESELRRLEAEIAGDWAVVESDIPLTHDVKAADLCRQAQLGEMTQRTLQRRMRHVRIEQHLLNPAGTGPLAKVARYLQRKLRIANRLEALDGQLETYEYVYELANQRMAEYANFRREYLVEWLIVIVLALEVVVVIAELFLAYHA